MGGALDATGACPFEWRSWCGGLGFGKFGEIHSPSPLARARRWPCSLRSSNQWIILNDEDTLSLRLGVPSTMEWFPQSTNLGTEVTIQFLYCPNLECSFTGWQGAQSNNVWATVGRVANYFWIWCTSIKLVQIYLLPACCSFHGDCSILSTEIIVVCRTKTCSITSIWNTGEMFWPWQVCMDWFLFVALL